MLIRLLDMHRATKKEGEMDILLRIAPPNDRQTDRQTTLQLYLTLSVNEGREGKRDAKDHNRQELNSLESVRLRM
jgi:hypothetical protein